MEKIEEEEYKIKDETKEPVAYVGDRLLAITIDYDSAWKCAQEFDGIVEAGQIILKQVNPKHLSYVVRL